MKVLHWLMLSLGFCVALPTEAQVRILPLGDSITSSSAPYSSYRAQLWRFLVNAGFDVDFVGSQHGVTGGSPADTDYDRDHEGHPGWTTQDGLENIDSIMAFTQPDIVLLDLGGNDVLQQLSVDDACTNLLGIINQIRARNPNAVILLANPTPFEGQDRYEMARLRSRLRYICKVSNTPDSPIKRVNLFGGFSVRRDTFDGTHPNELGELKIAKRYFRVLKKVLKTR